MHSAQEPAAAGAQPRTPPAGADPHKRPAGRGDPVPTTRRNPPRERYEVRRIAGPREREPVSWHLDKDRAIAAAIRTGADHVVRTHPEDAPRGPWLDDAALVWQRGEPAPALRSWLVLDMDEGVIRREPTRRAAVAWIIGQYGGRVLQRHSIGPGRAYEYVVGEPGEDCTASFFVEHLDAAISGGWEPLLAVPDAYPYPGEPHREADADRGPLLAEARRREREDETPNGH